MKMCGKLEAWCIAHNLLSGCSSDGVGRHRRAAVVNTVSLLNELVS